MLATTVKGVLVAKWKDIVSTTLETFLGIRLPPRVIRGSDTGNAAAARAARLDQCYNANTDLFAYKARPLDGIWATPPYLHNGSVPTLFDLLRAPADRPVSFQTGTREFDPQKVGYKTGTDAPGNTFRLDTTLTGNRNVGHDYHVGDLTDEQRWALVEYMKTL
jgi:cytochrome c peroxidase